MKENFANFATSQVAGTALTTSTLSVSVTPGTGGAFPPIGPFTVTIDTEILLIGSRSGDTLTVTMRGYDNSLAAPHAIGASVQQDVLSYTFNHLWSNVADTFSPDVPPAQETLSASGVLTGSASSYDCEFEAGLAPAWTLSPSPAPAGSSLDIGVSLQSHLLLNRYGVNDNGLYSAYQPFAVSGAWSATCKLSDGINIPQNGTSGIVETHFFVSDRTNPTASADVGNRVRLDVVTHLVETQQTISGTASQVVTQMRLVRCSLNTNGVWTPQNPYVPVATAVPLYLRITTDGNGTWNTYVGDGFTYTLVANIRNVPLACQSIGFQFTASQTSPYYVSHTAAIDFLRIRLAAQSPAYGA